jgi:hypothetical protein
MKIIYLLKLLAEVCGYNALGEVYVYVNGKPTPVNHCVDDFVGEGDQRKRVITLVAEGDDYHGR